MNRLKKNHKRKASTMKVIKKNSRKFNKPLGLTSIPDEEELKYLEKAVLGNSSNLFEGSLTDDDDSDEEISSKKQRQLQPESEKKPAWVDDDDNFTFSEVVKKQKRRCRIITTGSKDYKEITKQKFQQVMGVPKWAKSSNRKDAAEDLLNTCGKFLRKPNYLKNGSLEYKKLKHLNFQTNAEGPFINVVKFHPKSTVAMVAGVSGIVSLFQVDGKENPKLQSIQFKNYPINCGAFVRNGEEFLIGSQHYKFFHCHNLMTGKSFKVNHAKLANITKTKNFCVSPNDDLIALCGNTGQIFLLAASTKEYVDCLQMNEKVTALSFSRNGSTLYSHGEGGEVYIWDMKSRTCMKKFYDDGCLDGASVCVSANDQLIACGSSSGIVNIYDRESVVSGAGTLPIKTIYNLVTPVTSTVFNAYSEVLAIASREKENAVKLVHCPSMSVFHDFPQFNSKITKPLCLDFSPNSGFLAVGDSNGSAHLFRLQHYGNY